MLHRVCPNFAQKILTNQCAKWKNINCNNISSSACCRSAEINHYEALGIPKSSTQRDIKAAYYKLSMQYHPDKNQGSEEAAQKFREISQAYEVLGNYKLRRLYDKGVRSGFGPAENLSRHDEYVPEDDDETKFYKSRFRKSAVPSEGRTPIYDFDEWSRAHYGKSFERRQKAKSKFDRKQNEKRTAATSLQNEFVLFGLISILGIVYLIFRQESKYDTPAERNQRNNNNNNSKDT